jgi:hypothetical protein
VCRPGELQEARGLEVRVSLEMYRDFERQVFLSRIGCTCTHVSKYIVGAMQE